MADYHYFRKGEKSTIKDYDMKMIQYTDEAPTWVLDMNIGYREAYLEARKTDVWHLKKHINQVRLSIAKDTIKSPRLLSAFIVTKVLLPITVAGFMISYGIWAFYMMT